MNVGFVVQLEGNTESDQVDESYAFVESEQWGAVYLGSENSSGYLKS